MPSPVSVSRFNLFNALNKIKKYIEPIAQSDQKIFTQSQKNEINTVFDAVIGCLDINDEFYSFHHIFRIMINSEPYLAFKLLVFVTEIDMANRAGIEEFKNIYYKSSNSIDDWEKISKLTNGFNIIKKCVLYTQIQTFKNEITKLNICISQLMKNYQEDHITIKNMQQQIHDLDIQQADHIETIDKLQSQLRDAGIYEPIDYQAISQSIQPYKKELLCVQRLIIRFARQRLAVPVVIAIDTTK